MERTEAVAAPTDVMAKFAAHIGKRLSTDIKVKLAELREAETMPLATAIYNSMAENQEAADRFDRPASPRSRPGVWPPPAVRRDW